MELADAQVAHLPSLLLEETFVRSLHSNGFVVHGSNLNSEDEVREAMIVGIDQFSTDRLEMALTLRRELADSPASAHRLPE
jgi:hypothetical protein